MLMVSPYWANRDENLFENPDVFMPERWENKKATLDGFIGFGGGRYRCPGRYVFSFLFFFFQLKEIFFPNCSLQINPKSKGLTCRLKFKGYTDHKIH